VFRALAGNRALLRVVAAYALFTLAESAVWMAMLVYAYAWGGTTAAGLIAVAQLAPAALLAPVLSALTSRRSPVVLLVGGYLVQAAGMGATAAGAILGVPAVAFAAAVVTATAVTATRPAQSTLFPSLAATPDQLTAVNVVVGWVEAAGFTVAASLTGLLIWLSGVAAVFAAGAVLGLAAAQLVAGLRVPPLAAPEREDAADGGLRSSIRLAARQPKLRLMLALMTAQSIVSGALDLLFVILAVSVLGRSQAWVGYLNAADGVGAILAAAFSVLLIGKRLGMPILVSALLLSSAVAATAGGVGLAGTLALLAAVGASHELLDIASRTLLQRSVPAQSLGQVFGLLEGLAMAGYALGTLLVPALVHLGGSRLALLGVAALLPLAAVAGGRALFIVDAEAPVPVVQIALLRSIPLFAQLPAPDLEGLAAALTPLQVPAGTTLITRGETGDTYYAIASGELDVTRDGQLLHQSGRGEGVGEIALLRSIPRTATVTARTDALVYELGREPFLTAVLGHAATRGEANRIADRLLAANARRDSPDPAP